MKRPQTWWNRISGKFLETWWGSHVHKLVVHNFNTFMEQPNAKRKRQTARGKLTKRLLCIFQGTGLEWLERAGRTADIQIPAVLQLVPISHPNHAPSLPQEELGECISLPPVWNDWKQIIKERGNVKEPKIPMGDLFHVGRICSGDLQLEALTYLQGWEKILKCWLKPKMDSNGKTIALK